MNECEGCWVDSKKEFCSFKIKNPEYIHLCPCKTCLVKMKCLNKTICTIRVDALMSIVYVPKETRKNYDNEEKHE